MGQSRKKKKRTRCRRKVMKLRLARVTSNPFLNFLRLFRKKHSDWSPKKASVESARKWCSMSKAEKDHFVRQACRAARRAKGYEKRRTKKCKRRKKATKTKHRRPILDTSSSSLFSSPEGEGEGQGSKSENPEKCQKPEKTEQPPQSEKPGPSTHFFNV